MARAPSLGREPPGSGAPRILFLTAFIIDFSRFEVHFRCSVWVLTWDSILGRIWYMSRINLGNVWGWGSPHHLRRHRWRRTKRRSPDGSNFSCHFAKRECPGYKKWEAAVSIKFKFRLPPLSPLWTRSALFEELSDIANRSDRRLLRFKTIDFFTLFDVSIWHASYAQYYRFTKYFE